MIERVMILDALGDRDGAREATAATTAG